MIGQRYVHFNRDEVEAMMKRVSSDSVDEPLEKGGLPRRKMGVELTTSMINRVSIAVGRSTIGSVAKRCDLTHGTVKGIVSWEKGRVHRGTMEKLETVFGSNHEVVT